MRTLDALSGCRSTIGQHSAVANLNPRSSHTIRYRSPPDIGRRQIAHVLRAPQTRRSLAAAL